MLWSYMRIYSDDDDVVWYDEYEYEYDDDDDDDDDDDTDEYGV